MSAVTISCSSVEGVFAGAQRLYVTIDVTADQRRDAVLALLGAIPEQEAFEFIRAEFSEWFKVGKA